MEARRVTNYELAQLVSFAFHEPNEMPEYKAVGEEEAPVNNELATMQVSAYFRALAERGG